MYIYFHIDIHSISMGNFYNFHVFVDNVISWATKIMLLNHMKQISYGFLQFNFILNILLFVEA